MELSKAFDMINHSLFLVRLKAYCFFDQVLCLQDVSCVTKADDNTRYKS